MKRTIILTILFCLLFCLSIIVYFAPSKAQTSIQTNSTLISPTPEEALQESFSKLISAARKRGSVRVIIGLRFEGFKPVGELSEVNREQQKSEIRKRQEDLLSSLAFYDFREVKQFEFIPFIAAEVGVETLEAIHLDPVVASIHEDVADAPTLAESVPLVGAPAAWSSGYSGNGWSVAVLDTGVDKFHSLLSGKVGSEACYSSNFPGNNVTSVCPGGVTQSTAPNSGLNCSLTIDGCTHGTHVAGIAAGNNSNLRGVAKDAGLIAIQVFSRFNNQSNCEDAPAPCARTFTSDQILGLERVLTLSNSMNIAAVNMSLGGGEYFSNCDDDPRKAAIDNLRSVGVATVISSGNYGYTNALGAPACISTAISVGASGDGSGGWVTDEVTSYSNSASFLNLLAPGSLINSSVPGGGYANFNGTSMAAPHVAGTWAVLKQKKPTASVSEILTAISSTGLPVTDFRNNITKPRIRVDAALSSIITVCSSTPISFDQTVNGSLEPGDCIRSDGKFYDAYSFAGSAGQNISVSMQGAHDTYLYLVDNNNQVIAEDDDGGGGTNSRIPPGSGFLPLPASGNYTILASSYSPAATGTYSLTLSTNAGTPTPTVTATPTITPTPTITATPTITPTPTISPTPVQCTYSLDPPGRTFSSSATSSFVSVITQPGCQWSATVNTSTSPVSSIMSELLLWFFANPAPESIKAREPLLSNFSNISPITINDRLPLNPPAAATPYPSNISVFGLDGIVSEVTATIKGFNHTFPDDVDVILVGPGGQRAILVSDAGGGVDVTGANLTFSQNAGSGLPDNSLLTSGIFRPSNYAGNPDLEPGAIDNFPFPGPGADTFSFDLAVFNGSNPNGTWSLYVTDDENVDSGTITAGWELSITTVSGGTSWINITSGAAGNGSGSVNYSVAANPNASPRNGEIRINNSQAHSIIQSGIGTPTLTPTATATVTPTPPPGGRTIGILSAAGSPGGQVLVSVELTSLGNEAATQFSVNFDPSRLSISSLSTPNINPDVMLGSGVPPGTSLTVNGNQALLGRIGLLIDSNTSFTASPPARQIVILRFTVASNASAGTTPLTFGDTPVSRSTSDAFGNPLSSNYVNGSVAITGGNNARFDYDGDGRTDVSVWRPSNGGWYLNRSTAGFIGISFGLITDKIAPADYDGDGKIDEALFRPSEGGWYFLKSTTNTYSGLVFGTAGDIPAPGDFDGDGRADVAIFRPSTGHFWLAQTTAGVTVIPFGINGDVPVIGDYDGDGKDDVAIYRPSNGQWWINRSSGGVTAVTFGIPGDKVTHADYDGDGKTDISVYRPSTSAWYWINSSTLIPTGLFFGTAGDIPAPGDYDGDGRTDQAIFRPSNGQWWFNCSTTPKPPTTFGLNGDVPTPNAHGN